MEDLISSQLPLPQHTSTTHYDQINTSGGGGEESQWLETGGKQTLVIIVQTILLIFFCVLGTLTNSLVLWLFNRRPALRSLSNRFVLSLVTGNILISSVIAPLMLLEAILKDYLIMPCLPQLISMTSSSVIFAAIFSTLLIATDRFYAVTSPLHYSMTITRSRSQVMIVLVWVLGLSLAFPYILICLLPQHLHQKLHVLYIITQLLLGYLLPFCGLCWLYLRMYNAAHRNSERTRKHSISGELLTVLDGSSSIIPPQGIDFLTHYINPFTKPMAGSSQGVNASTPAQHNNQIVPAAVKKQRRRSSNGSSSSLLFREEGRAIKTALWVLASFLICWTPHFAFMFMSELDLVQRQLMGEVHIFNNMETSITTTPTTLLHSNAVMGADWVRFFGIFGILLSCLLNPFIYVFRNKMACKEVSKLWCTIFRENRRIAKQDAAARERNHQHLLHHSRDRSDSCVPPQTAPNCANHHHNHHQEPLEYHPRYSPCLGKSPKRSSLKSLTPQSSINSTTTNCITNANSPLSLNGTTSSTILLATKPPFIRSMTVPEQTQPRVKFPPHLTRQKSCIHRTVYNGCQGGELTPALSKRSKFVRQDSICSILSNDSVLMICADDELCLSEGLLNRGSSGGGGVVTLQQQHSYLRQDSNFSDASHKTNDSGVVLSMSTSAKQSAANSPSFQNHSTATPTKHITHLQTTI